MADNRKLSLFNSNTLSKFSDIEKSKIHPAISYFRRLQRSISPIELKEFLSSFDVARAINSNTFTEGVKKFITLANKHPTSDEIDQSNRKQLYGNIYLGLHYRNDLADLWNTNSRSEYIQASQVSTLSPLDWDSIMQDGYSTLIYRGQQPAQALDQLVKGPTVIDCGMFAQLSLWFGIRYMLGNERFNQCFGRTPFFITQSVYNAIENSAKPYLGNPLYPFLTTTEEVNTSSVVVKHISNTSLYHLKHPGGNYGGENCILIESQYYLFDPDLENNHGLTKEGVLNLLRHAFNEKRQQYEIDRLALYALNPTKFHPKLLLTYEGLIQAAEELTDKNMTDEEFLSAKQDASLELMFDLNKFSNWLQVMENNMKRDQVEYVPQSINYDFIPNELLNVIPFENRMSMDFSKFKQEKPQQKELIEMSKQFCQSMMLNESKLVILTGKAGVGKTASAVCAAKELAINGKKIVWISEVMVKGWADQSKSIGELGNCDLEIDRLLATNPDAVFLDDDNLAGYSGHVLLEKIYTWYVINPGKGLFITSNEIIRFNECYGYSLDEQYHYPPFSNYNSSQYIKWRTKIGLAGESLRSKQDGQSIGAIVSDASWKENQDNLKDIEMIPGYDNDELVEIRQSLAKTGSEGAAYDRLTSIQKKWLHQHMTEGICVRLHGKSHNEPTYLTVNPTKFEKTTRKTIALEIRDFGDSYSSGKMISFDCINQLMRVLNYAHDQGGRRIILINQTCFSNEKLLAQIKAQLPSSESERTWSRLMLLLCETEETIFNYDQFNGHLVVELIMEIMKKPLNDPLGLDSNNNPGLYFFNDIHSNNTIDRNHFRSKFSRTGKPQINNDKFNLKSAQLNANHDFFKKTPETIDDYATVVTKDETQTIKSKLNGESQIQGQDQDQIYFFLQK